MASVKNKVTQRCKQQKERKKIIIALYKVV